MTCPHHWVIEPANGPRSRGVCKKCGALRAFRNAPQTVEFGYKPHSEAGHKQFNIKKHRQIRSKVA